MAVCGTVKTVVRVITFGTVNRGRRPSASVPKAISYTEGQHFPILQNSNEITDLLPNNLRSM
jgi:hypothetical protein